MSTNSINSLRRNLIAVCQMTSQHDLKKNLKVCTEMVERAKHRDAKMIFFPECFDFIGRTKEEIISLSMDVNGEFVKNFRDLAKKHEIWISLGGLHHKDSSSSDLPFNSHLVIDNSGETKALYKKLHLFDLDLPNKVRLMESEFSSSGKKLVLPVETPIGKLGLSICYDVRFPELSLWNRYKGAEILSFPSSFTVNTGLAHWETLLRCRAIETQCYVIAAGQTGKHNEKRSSYGHSMVIDPWGAIIAQCSERVDLCFAEIDLDYVCEVREVQPLMQHRRSDLYSLHFNTLKTEEIESRKFHIFDIPKETIFYQTDLSFAFVNLKPVLPGHVLCAPKRVVKKLTDLSDQETADLFNLAKNVQKLIEEFYAVTSATISIQDGVEAGQTVPHTHVHILPRKSSDFNGCSNQIYKELQGHENRQPRDLEEMILEVRNYRNFLKSK